MVFNKKTVLIVIACVAMLAFVGYSYLNSSPMSDGKTIVFQIKPGQGFASVAQKLAVKGYVRSLTFFKLLGKLRGASRRIKAGCYRIDSSTSASGVLDMFIEGKVYTIRVTIPEGYDNRRIAKLLAKKGLVDEKEFLKEASDGSLLVKFGFRKRKTAEGFLFPDTYMIPWGLTARQVVEMMISTFKQRVGSALIQKMRDSRIGFYKSLILASIVEREAVVPQERAKIAGVFLNRYKKRMKFESCATIQYILGEVRKKLFYSHLRIESPYNTYQNVGFPVGPIANPGLRSLKAAASPARHSYLYFVSKNDGTHIFSRTGRAHNRAARKYQWNK